MRRPVIEVIRIVLLVTTFVFPISPLYAQSLVVADYAWTSAVSDLQPVDRLHTTIESQQLFLWLRIEANEDALRVLEKKGMLPIRCRWVHYVGTMVSLENSRELIDEIKLGVGTNTLVAKLKQEIVNNPNHGFDWRTWSMKKQIQYGDWEVEVVYSDPQSTPLLCLPKHGREPVPCHFEISVR